MKQVFAITSVSIGLSACGSYSTPADTTVAVTVTVTVTDTVTGTDTPMVTDTTLAG